VLHQLVPLALVELAASSVPAVMASSAVAVGSSV